MIRTQGITERTHLEARGGNPRKLVKCSYGLHKSRELVDVHLLPSRPPVAVVAGGTPPHERNSTGMTVDSLALEIHSA